MNRTVDEFTNEMNNVFMICPDKKEGDMKSSREVCKRLESMTSVFESEGILGCQFSGDGYGTVLASVFSSRDTGISELDYKWIFSDYGQVKEVSPEELSIIDNKEGKVYSLIESPYEPNSDHDNERGEDVDPYYIWDMLVMIAESGGSFRMSVCGGKKSLNSGSNIFISVPGELSLRMRSMISICFPNHLLCKVNPECVEDYHPYMLENKIVCETIARTLCAYAYYYDRSDSTESDGGRDKDADPERKTDDFSDVSIEELELSVRAFNCLKRAHIDTVSDLLKLSDDDLMHVRNLGKKSFDEVREKLRFYRSENAQGEGEKKDYMKELESLIGLESVKEQVKRIACFARLKKDMPPEMRSSSSMSLNMSFIGNPGTAKTTVARILSGILYDIGLLKSSRIVEVGRADLVGQYAGHTADRVKKVFKEAKGKLLFIDEAYSLVEKWENAYGDEAINTIVQEMENNRSDTIVVFAGYPDKMKDFFDRNPGLKSRVPFSICFKDYSAEEMTRIAKYEAEKRNFKVNDEACEKILKICTEASADPENGNGRFSRNLIESAIMDYAVRVCTGECANEKDYILEADDFGFPESASNTHTKPVIGFV